MAKYFGTDGFRGLVGKGITAWHAYKIGRFLGWYFGARTGDKCRAVIGKDPRLSSYTLEYSLCAGITASGGDAYILHVTTTPNVSYVARSENFDCGIMVSASHNPYYDNGVKLFNSQGEKMDESVVRLIEKYLDDDVNFTKKIPFATGENVGKTVDYVAGRNRYTGFLIGLSAYSFKGFRVGLDCANGSAYKIAKSVFDALGAVVYAIGDEPNGINVNDGVGSTNVCALKNLVIEKGLDVGFAFDGDADRCICVDECGRVRDGDCIIYALATTLKKKNGLGDGVVATIMSNCGLKESLERQGVAVHICDVGDRNVYLEMQKTGATLGGEQSGHVILGKIENAGDGVATAVAIMQAMIEEKASLTELCKGLTLYPQTIKSVRVKDKSHAVSCANVRAVVDEIEKNTLHGRVLLRKSGTEEMVRVMVECDDLLESERLCSIIVDAVKSADGQDV